MTRALQASNTHKACPGRTGHAARWRRQGDGGACGACAFRACRGSAGSAARRTWPGSAIGPCGDLLSWKHTHAGVM